MTDALISAVYGVLAIVTCVTLVLTIRKKRKSKLDGNLVFIGAMLLGWEFFEISFYLTNDPLIAQYCFDLKLPFVALTSLSWFLYTINFYGMEKTITTTVVIALIVIPVFTFGLAATTTDHGLIREQFTLIEVSPLTVTEQTRGPWFWFHFAYCYTLIAASVIICLSKHWKTPKGYRFPSSLLVVGLIVCVLGNIFVVVTSSAIDLSLVGAAISYLILYQATRNYQGLAFVIAARRAAFHHIEEAVFILAADETIVNMNKSAQEWLDELGIHLQRNSFSSVIKELRGLSEQQVALIDADGGTDYYFESGVVYNVRVKAIEDNDGKPIGYFAFVADETTNRELIEYLDRHSGIDALTGLSNRRRTEEDVETLDHEEFYPLAVIFGDLNYLKETNDKFGHQQGDVLLRLAAEAMKTVCPPSARIGRIGGDEFIILLPNHKDDQVLDLFDQLRSFLKRESERYPFVASIALGYAIKRSKDQNITAILEEADENMYTDKRRIKAANKTKTLV